MASLSRIWFIVETVLIPDGFRKWYCLSFFIHPFLLVLCQIFLWVEYLTIRLSTLVFHPLIIIWYMILRVFIFLRDCVVCMFSRGGSDDYHVIQDDERRFEVLETRGAIQSIVLHDCCRVLQIMGEIPVEKEHGFGEEEDNKEEHGFEEDEENKEEHGFEEDEENKEESDIDIIEGDSDTDESSSLECSSSESPIMVREVENEREEVEIDEFYRNYTERMRWFDLLNSERTCGLSAILNNKQLETSSLLESIKPMSLSLPYISWSKAAKSKLIRSLESDFEMVYVGQLCLCWEALHHQYRKVEALASSASLGGAFYDNVTGKFQQFRVLLERFLENETTKGKRFWNYVQGRSSMKNLLQVPEVPGHLEEENDGMVRDKIFSREVMKAIEKSIRTFWVFLKTDQKSSWQLPSLLWANPQVEDPRDLGLLAHLTKTLQKKELGMKNLPGRKRRWLKRSNPLDDPQRLEVLFSMIDMKLVSRVLKMTVISTHQLKWCQEKLNNIDFKDEKVVRTCTSCLFPPS